MKPANNRFSETLVWCGVALLVAVGLPVMALTIIVLRPVVLALVGVAGVVVLSLFCIGSPARMWVRARVLPSGRAHS